jgi:hypothetical protein
MNFLDNKIVETQMDNRVIGSIYDQVLGNFDRSTRPVYNKIWFQVRIPVALQVNPVIIAIRNQLRVPIASQLTPANAVIRDQLIP